MATAGYVKINGVEVPVSAVNGPRVAYERIGASDARGWDGKLVSSERGIKREWELETGLMKYEDAERLKKIIDGEGDWWSFDDGLISSKGIAPNAGHVATMRPGEGKFGGAVAVEEGTTNFVPNGWTWNDWIAGSYDGNTCDVEVVDINGIPTLHIYNVIQPSRNDYPRIQGPMFAYVATGTLTSSFYAWSSGAGHISLRYYESGSTKQHHNESVDGTRRRYGQTITVSEALDRAYFVPEAGYEYWIQMPQLEAKPFPTSFVNGTRAGGVLDYPVSIYGDFTIAFQWTPSMYGNSKDKAVLALSNGTNVLNFFEGYGSDWYLGDETYRTRFHIADFTPTPYTFYQIVLLREGTRVSVYRNGAFWDSVDFGAAPSFTMLRLGGFSPEANLPNGLIDELLILPYAASEEEILAIYNSTQSYPPKPYFLLGGNLFSTPTLATGIVEDITFEPFADASGEWQPDGVRMRIRVTEV